MQFDEVEKAHSSLWRQMLAFFDEGRVSDTLGQTLAPKNTICLLTSNIEADKIAENPDSAKDIIKQCGYFPTEFLEHRFSNQEPSSIEREREVWGVWEVWGESR